MHIRIFSVPFTFTILQLPLDLLRPAVQTVTHRNIKPKIPYQIYTSGRHLLVRVVEMITATKVAPLFQCRSHQCCGYAVAQLARCRSVQTLLFSRLPTIIRSLIDISHPPQIILKAP